MSKLPSVINLHNEVFPKYKNINQDKSVVLIATGPSLKKFFPIDNAVYIGVNRAFEYEKVKFDYLFLQDYVGIQECMDSFMNYEPDYTTKFLGILSIYAFPYTIIPPRYGLYKNVERYYAAPPLEKENYTFDISSDYLGDSYSIVFPAMQFILWTHPKKIYLAGCDVSNLDDVSLLMAKGHITQKVLLEKFKNVNGEYIPQSTFSCKIRRNTLKLSETQLICKLLGYRIKIEPEN